MAHTSNRREFLKTMAAGGAVAAGVSPLLSFLGCASTPGSGKLQTALEIQGGLPFRSIPPSTVDDFLVSPDFQKSLVVKWGETINAAGQAFGYNNDYIAFVPTHKGAVDDLLMWVNHEYPHPFLQTGFDYRSAKTRAQVETEMDSMSGSIVRIRRGEDGFFHPVANDPLNRRIHGRTMIPFAGGREIRGKKAAMGMVSNCAGGMTPWGTYLSCEENYDLFYGERMHGSKHATFENAKYEWYRYYENPPEHYGYVVEIEPFTGRAKKHVALGRFAHEGATIRLAKDGRPVAYMGDDVGGGCLYKFVSDRPGSLVSGTLYAADTVNGRWIPLDLKRTPVLRARYRTQLEILIDARAAAHLAGGTMQDRPEDIEIHPFTGDVICALTNNKTRGNYYGSLLKIREKNNDPLAGEFEASTFLAGGKATGFACPDNLEFDQNGNLWFTSDISDDDVGKGEYDGFGHNALFVVPMAGDGAGKAFRVASAPIDAELTGPKFTPDYKSLFLSVQHPGANSKSPERITSRWPEGGDSLPKPAVVEIRGEALERFARKN